MIERTKITYYVDTSSVDGDLGWYIYESSSDGPISGPFRTRERAKEVLKEMTEARSKWPDW